MSRRSHCLVLPVLAVLAAAGRAGNVLVVGPGPQDLPEIQAAVDAAIDGDVVLVKSGSYLSFVVTNKAITIAADVGQTVLIEGAVRARALSADRTLVLSGLQASGRVTPNAVEGDGLFLKNCLGPVRVESCVLSAWTGGTPGSTCATAPRHGAEIEGCAAVSFVRCTLIGTTLTGLTSGAGLPTPPEGRGLFATGSKISLHDSMVQGGHGSVFCAGPNAGCDSASGGHGCKLVASELYVSGSTIRGGNGGDATGHLCYAGDGGYGLIFDGSSIVRRLDSVVTGGTAGTAFGCATVCQDCCNGAPGGAVDAPPAAVYQVLPGTRRALLGPAVARESTSPAISVHGLPGDVLSLAFRTAPGFAFDPVQSGVVLTGGQGVQRYVYFGILTGNSTSGLLPMPALPATDLARRYYLQCSHRDSNGQRWLGSPLSIAVLDAAH